MKDCVRVDIGDGSVITKRLEEIRLMESRKSARLVNSDTDFSLLADFNIVERRADVRKLVTSFRFAAPALCV